MYHKPTSRRGNPHPTPPSKSHPLHKKNDALSLVSLSLMSDAEKEMELRTDETTWAHKCVLDGVYRGAR